MPNQIWSPEEGDEVQMKDGRTGILGDIDSFIWDGGNDWQVSLHVPAGELEKDEEDGVEAEQEEDEDRTDVLIRYEENWKGWKEV